MLRIIGFISLALFSRAVGGQVHSIDSLQHLLQKSLTAGERIKITLMLSDRMSESSPMLALEYANESEQLAHKLKSDSLLARSLLNQANIFTHLGNYPRSLQLYQNGINLAQKAGDDYMLAVGYGNIGTIYYHQRDHVNALKYFRDAITAFEKVQEHLDNPRLGRKANLLSNMGIIFEEAKRFDSAAWYYKQAYDISEKMRDDRMMANILNNMGTLSNDQGDVGAAFTFYHRAMALRKKSNNQLGMTRSYNNLGQFYTEKGNNPDSALVYLRMAINLGKEIGAWQTVQSSSEMLYKLYEKQGRYQEALEMLQLNTQVNDSLFNAESTQKIVQLEMQFKFDQQQNLLRAEQKEKELYIWMVAGGLVLMLIIVTLLFFLQRNKTRRSELEQAHLQLERAKLKNDLAIKDKELATNIMYLLNKNELINHMSEKLLDIKTQLTAENQQAIQKLILDLQSNLQPELWQEFEFRFQQVHEGFYNTLNEKFPELTASDRRLCAFLKLNMTTKEISAITHQNAKSIDVARTRLRKKLNLTGTDQNLVNFLAQLGANDPDHPRF